jgi:hypothetical protein
MLAKERERFNEFPFAADEGRQVHRQSSISGRRAGLTDPSGANATTIRDAFELRSRVRRKPQRQRQ